MKKLEKVQPWSPTSETIGAGGNLSNTLVAIRDLENLVLDQVGIPVVNLGEALEEGFGR